MRIGLAFQPGLLQLYSEDTKREVRPITNEIWLGDPPFFFSPDGATVDPIKGEGFVEVKNAALDRTEDWKDEPPLATQVQVQHGLMVTGFLWAGIGACIGGGKFVYVDVDRNQQFIDLLKDRETEFWRRVELKDPPPPDASDSAKAAITALYPTETGETISLGAGAIHWADLRDQMRTRENDAKEQYDLASNHLKTMMGKATFGLLPDGRKFSFKETKVKGYTVEPKKYRALRKAK